MGRKEKTEGGRRTDEKEEITNVKTNGEKKETMNVKTNRMEESIKGKMEWKKRYSWIQTEKEEITKRKKEIERNVNRNEIKYKTRNKKIWKGKTKNICLSMIN